MAHIRYSDLEIILILKETVGQAQVYFSLSELDEAATGTEKIEGRYIAKHLTMYKIDSEWRNVRICQ